MSKEVVRHPFKFGDIECFLIVTENGFYITTENEGEECPLIDASTIFKNPNDWIEFFASTKETEIYININTDQQKVSSFGIRTKKENST